MKLLTAVVSIVVLCAIDSFASGYAKVYKHVVPSVVSLHMHRSKGEFRCTGFLVDSVHIVTCAHCIEARDVLHVFAYPFGASENATILGVDPKHDLALLTLDRPMMGTVPANLADSDKMSVGDSVLVIGNALGFLDWSATAGIVSGLNRLGINRIQTDSPINPGNSGGPVFNMRGEVVGVAELSIRSADDVNFFIPSNTVRHFIERYMVARGFWDED